MFIPGLRKTFKRQQKKTGCGYRKTGNFTFHDKVVKVSNENDVRKVRPRYE